MQKRKPAHVTARAFHDSRSYIGALRAPGRPDDFRVEMVHHNPGSVFEGAFERYLEDNNIINSRSEVDRHTAKLNEQVQNRNKLLAVTSAPLLHTAVGSNNYIVEQLSGEVKRWSTQCINNSAITSYPKENNITAYEEYAGISSPIVNQTVFTMSW